MLLQGRYKPQNPQKYRGDPTNIIYRSSWEFSVCYWCDFNPKVQSWSSEEIVIPYKSLVDKKIHRYFPDFKITFSDGKTYIIEVKPKSQTIMPTRGKSGKLRYKRLLEEYARNVSKWSAAKEYAQDRNFIFDIWDQEKLKKLGINIIR
jgi:hypothetical protein